jgi:hypothetical protein
MSGYGGSGPQGGKSLLLPEYTIQSYNSQITAASLNTNLPIEFPRVTGHQEIILQFMPAVPGPVIPTCSFFIKGGSNTEQTTGLPMFPNTQKVYNQTITYMPAESSKSCILETLPQPKNTTRINVFRLTELVTGNGYIFEIAFSPFTRLRPTITFVAGQPPFIQDRISLTNFFYRGNSNMTASGIPISFGAPNYYNRVFNTNLISSGGVNPLDNNLRHPFKRVNGIQDITVKISSTGFTFSFPIDYGIITQANGYIGFVSPTTRAKIPRVAGSGAKVQNCILEEIGTQLPVNGRSVFSISTPTDPDGARVYEFIFDPNPNQVEPTIRLLSGPLLGASNVNINITTRYFSSV